MIKFKQFIMKFFGPRVFKLLSNIKYLISTKFSSFSDKIKYFIKKIKSYSDKKYIDSMKNTINSIEKCKNADYIIFHNPTFIGVTSATKELFDNPIPLLDLYKTSDINKITKAITDNNINQVFFSAFCINWYKLIVKIKKKNPSIKIKTYWHGSHSQVIDSYGWKRNCEIIDLHKKGYVDVYGSCKNSLIEFYKKNDFNACFLNNTVNFDGSKYVNSKTNKKPIIGIYSANPEWRKNMFSQIAAVKLIKGASIDMVPINLEGEKFAKSLGIKVFGEYKPIPREELLKRMANNDVNLYVTYSECDPMVPPESMEVGVPCVSGNNHHNYKNMELEKYIIVNNENDILEIKEKLELCMKNREKIIKLYQKWKQDNDDLTKQTVKEFIER